MHSTMNTGSDIRDIEAGETYYVVADSERGGRCVMNGMFIAAWRERKVAHEFAKSRPAIYTVVKSLKA